MGTICSEGGAWQKDVDVGCDLATAHSHTAMARSRERRKLTCSTTRNDRSDVEKLEKYLSAIKLLKRKDLEAQRIRTLGRDTLTKTRARATPLRCAGNWWNIGGKSVERKTDGILFFICFILVSRGPPILPMVESVEHRWDMWTDPRRAHRKTVSPALGGHRRTDTCRSVAPRRCTV